MKNFITKKLIAKKISFLISILCLFGLLIYLIEPEIQIARSYKFYYLKAQVSAIQYKLENKPEDIRAEDQSATSIPVILYHGIVDKPDGANVTFDNFKNQMYELKKSGYTTVKPEDIFEFSLGKKSLPDKSILITFDDGRKDSYYPTDPIFEALGFNAAMFAIGNVTDKNSAHLSTNELRKMIKSGRWSIQSHGFNDHCQEMISSDNQRGHWLSNKLWLPESNRLETDEEYKERIYNDMLESKNFFEKELDTKVTAFAYPFNDFGQESINYSQNAQNVIKEAVNSIYETSFYQVSPYSGSTFNYFNDKSKIIKRIDVKPEWTAQNFMQRIFEGEAKTLPYINSFDKKNEWIITKQMLDIANKTMELKSDDASTGSSAFLDGSNLWRDYNFIAQMNWMRGSNVFLLARYINDANYLAFNCSNDRVRIEQKIDENTKILKEIKRDLTEDKSDIELGIKVLKDHIEASIDGKTVIDFDGIDSKLFQGGIGFKTWDQDRNNSNILIKKVAVSEIK